MGSSKSKMVTPNNPLQELQLREFKRGQRKKQREKELRNQRKMEERNMKRHLKQQKHQKINEPVSTSYQPNYDLSLQEYELKIEQFLRAQLENNLCGFILNQMSFTLQFFGNFEREISAAYEYIWKQKENELNQQFEDHSILMANALDAAVERRVRYKPLHGPEKNQMQSLQPQTMYVVFENIDIARPNEANYDSLSPICKVDMETDFYKTTPCSDNYAPLLEQTKWKGFVRLRLRDTQVDSAPKAAGNDKGIYSPCGSTTSTSSRSINIRSSFSSSSDYDYAYITHLNSHHPLVELTMTNMHEKARVDAKVLPESCIADFQDYIEVPDDDDVEEEEEEEDYERNDDDPAGDDLVVSRFNLPPTKYLNSKEFMRYFGDLLRRKLASKLGLTEAEFESGTYRGSSIYTRNYEIIPAIHVAHNAQSWPDCAFQFKRRTRPVVVHQLTRKQFQWPTPDMIKRIETFGFHVIPMGYAPKKSKNPYREIEWKIIFPKAERYLETTLTNTQIKVFMIAKALVKTFIEPRERDNAMMFTIDHLRMHLFWECERNYVTWPEEFLGDVLLRFIRSFIDRLSRKSLPDFFIEGRNLFESIPDSSLVRLRDALVEIVENPVMHLIVALRNLTFLDDFIPKMDLKKIYSNLVENNYLKLRALSRNSKGALKLDEGSIDYWQMGDENAENQGLIGYTQPKDKGKKQLRRRTLLMKQNIEMLRRLDYERNRKSVDSINLEFVFSKNLKDSEKKKDINQGVENLRRTNILEIILDNLIAMAENCTETTENRSIWLARIYLKQAKRLCKFYRIYGCDTGAIEYISKIESIESQIAILRNTESDMPPPALPIRTSLEPVKSFRSKDATEVKGNIYVRQVSRTMPESPTEPRRSIKFANPFESKPMQVKATVHRPESLKKTHSQEDDIHTNKEPRRSIKFSDGKSSPTHMFRFDTDDDEAWPEVPNGIQKSPEFKLKPRRLSGRVANHAVPSDLSDSESNSDYDELRKPVTNGHANGGSGTSPISIRRQYESPQLTPSQCHSLSPPAMHGSTPSLHKFPGESTPPRSHQVVKTISIPDIYLNSERLSVHLNENDIRPHTPTTILRFANGTPTTYHDLNGLTPPRLPSTTSESSAASSVQAFTNFDDKRALLKDMLQKKTDRHIWIKGTGTSDT